MSNESDKYLDLKFSTFKDDIKELKEHLVYNTEETKKHVTHVQADIKELKDYIMDPDKGLVIRVRSLEKTKSLWSKLFWIVVSSSTAIVVAAIFS